MYLFSLKNPGIGPGTSRMLSGRSTICANSPDHVCHRKIVSLLGFKVVQFSVPKRQSRLQKTRKLYASAGRLAFVMIQVMLSRLSLGEVAE